jgi:hypothetical protein
MVSIGWPFGNSNGNERDYGGNEIEARVRGFGQQAGVPVRRPTVSLNAVSTTAAPTDINVTRVFAPCAASSRSCSIRRVAPDRWM